MRKRITNWAVFGLLGACLAGTAEGAIQRSNGPYLLPMNCKELLPDPGIFLGFLDAVAGGHAQSDKAFSKRLFRVLALRDKLADQPDAVRGQNPVDKLVFKTLCFYREQKEPIKAVPYDDAAFVSFLKGGLNELDKKVDEAVLHWELERQQRAEFEKQFKMNQAAIESLKNQAEKEAAKIISRAESQAQRKRRAN